MSGTSDHDDGRPAGPLTGRLLAGTYLVGGVLGEGAMGVVYAARHALLGTWYAIKVLRPERAADEHLRARFLREAVTLSRLVDPYIVTVRHVGHEDGLVYLVTDLCPGRTLSEVLAEEGSLAEPRATALAEDVLRALEAAHAAGVVHRDLKPANVMVEQRPDGTERARVLDFGLARLLEREDGLPPGALVTQDGEMVGTVAYMAPEQIRASADIGAAADQFALGVILYEMLAGELPFAGASTISMMMNVIESPPRPLPVEGLRAVSASTRGVLERALAKSPERRFPDAATFRRALRGEAVPPPPPSVVTAAPRAPRRAPWVVLALALGVLLAGGVLASRLQPGAKEVTQEQIEAARSTCAHESAATLARRRADALGDDAEAALVAAETAVAAGHLDADRQLDRAERLGGRSPRLLAATARYRWRVREERASALQAFDEAVLANPGDLDVQLDRVQLLVEALVTGESPREGIHIEGVIEASLGGMEQRASDDPRVHVLRAEYALALAARAEGAVRDAAEERADSALDKARAQAGAWGGPWVRSADLAQRRAYRTAAAGDHTEAMRWRDRARDDLDEAVGRAERAPNLYCQGLHRDAWLLRRAGARLAVDDTQGALADVRATLGSRLSDRGAAASLAWHLRYAGHFEEAIQLYEQVVATTQDGSAWFDLGYCHEHLAVEAERKGDYDEARRRHQRAIETWDRAATVLRDPAVVMAYRGEAKLRLSELAIEDAERETLVASAGDDFRVAREARADDQEVEFRRSVWLARTGDPRGGVAALAQAVGERRDLNPAFYARLGVLECAVAAEHLAGGDVQGAMAALERSTGWCDRVPRPGPEDDVGVAHVRAWIAVLRVDAEPGQEAAARAVVEGARLRLEEDGGAGARRAGAALGFVAVERSLAGEAIRTSVREARLAEIASARWPPGAPWLRALEAALEAGGRSEEAAAVGALASR